MITVAVELSMSCRSKSTSLEARNDGRRYRTLFFYWLPKDHLLVSQLDELVLCICDYIDASVNINTNDDLTDFLGMYRSSTKTGDFGGQIDRRTIFDIFFLQRGRHSSRSIRSKP